MLLFILRLQPKVLWPEKKRTVEHLRVIHGVEEVLENRIFSPMSFRRFLVEKKNIFF